MGERSESADVLALRALARDMALHLGQLCEHGYDHRYEGADPCGGCYDVMAAWADALGSRDGEPRA
jgi:hypothetical protein